MGAVMLGCGYKVDTHDWYEAHKATMELFPELLMSCDCPVDAMCTVFGNAHLLEVIMHLNDKHRWSRQRIAEWLSGTKVTENETIKRSAKEPVQV